jgi:hypothetical protein
MVIKYVPGRNFFQMIYRPLPSTAAHWSRLKGHTEGAHCLPTTLTPHIGMGAAPPPPHDADPGRHEKEEIPTRITC